jgi:surface antigen
MQKIWLLSIAKNRIVSLFTRHLLLIGVISAVLFTGAFSLNVFAKNTCVNGDTTIVVKGGDTLGQIAQAHKTTWQALASYNHLANSNFIYPGENICQQGSQAIVTMPQGPIHGLGNFFPYGQCTWGSNQEYHNLHGIWVPWTINSNAAQWTDRAYEFHWIVTTTPKQGSIANFQSSYHSGGVTISPLGHVGVVESLNSNGTFSVKQMDWNYQPLFSFWTFQPGNGVTFIASY